MKSNLKALALLILENVEKLEADCEQRGIEVPSLDEPFVPGSDITSKGSDPVIVDAIATVTNAALQLVHTIRPAMLNLMEPLGGVGLLLLFLVFH